MQRFSQFVENYDSVDFDEIFGEETTSQLINRIKAKTISKKKYEAAAKLVKQIYDRKKAEGGGAGPKHSSGYYAAQIAKQIPGVDARILGDMVAEEYGDMDRGTSSLTKKYIKDTPYQEVDSDIVKAKDGSYTYKGNK